MDGHRNSGNPPAPSRGSAPLDVKPLRSLSPMFPPAMSLAAASSAGTSPFVCITPFDPDGQVSNSSYEYFTAASNKPYSATNQAHGFFGTSGTAMTPSFQTPPTWNEDAQMSGQKTSSRGRKIKASKRTPKNDDADFDIDIADGSSKKKKRPKAADLRAKAANIRDLDLLPSAFDDPRLLADTVLTIFDALRRRLLQIEEVTHTSKRPDLKAGSIMMENDIRINKGKAVGNVPGVNVGDTFYFRFELCILGVHAQSMGGIDYINPKLNDENESVAVSIVSSGGYEDDSNDVDVLIYTGQGGGTNQTDDQKLERGNLALEHSLHKGNPIRVVRASKDMNTIGGKIYYYDGLYKVKESWTERGKTGFHVFKYKLLREPGQAGGLIVWNMTEKWRSKPSSRGGVIISDMSSGSETRPVVLVNELDSHRGPDPFSYSTVVRYLTSISSTNLHRGCSCHNVCVPGDGTCSCALGNGGELPYSSTGLLARRMNLVYECGPLCKCTGDCRNRLTQRGTRLHFEVFRTSNRGWGLRSWDPIRAGTFICEYTGEVVDMENANDNSDEDDYIFKTNQTGNNRSLRWNHVPQLLGEPSADDDDEIPDQLPITISAKRVGNISRFMNHSCYPNVFWQPVLYDHANEDYPHIMFFAVKHIPPMTELTYDYGRSGRRPKQCLCGAPKCRGSFG